MNLYWGDLHNHCGITYGFGSLENALAAAREQLDFCAVIGHAMWPDIPERSPETAFLVDFHRQGFDKLRRGWDDVRAAVKAANVPHRFVTFQGYEIHSAQHGDHHILSCSDELPLLEAGSPAALAAKLAPYGAIAVPHHVGYTPGYRGADWNGFDESRSPIAEVFSKHGCGMSDTSLYPYYHSMGPRDSRSTILAALKQKKKFGFVGSTDHHAGYPGSYGDGRVAVLAREKTREAIWEAILARRTYAVTGDKIDCRFSVNDTCFGGEVEAAPGSARHIYLKAAGCDAIDRIAVYKNGRLWSKADGRRSAPAKGPGIWKVRVELGWGDKEEGFSWDASAGVQGGRIRSAETCFRGRSVLAPTPEMREDPDINALGNRLLAVDGQSAVWTCTTFKNPSTLHPATAAVILEIEGDEATAIRVEANGRRFAASIAELREGARSAHLKPYTSEAIVLHRAVPEADYCVELEWRDLEREDEWDLYHAEIRQVNGQCAWISPVFVRE